LAVVVFAGIGAILSWLENNKAQIAATMNTREEFSKRITKLQTSN
jgi:hypothetical protein